MDAMSGVQRKYPNYLIINYLDLSLQATSLPNDSKQ